MTNTFIQLNRKILSWKWYSNANVSRLFIHCLIKANYRDKEWEDTLIKRGTFISSYSKIADELGLTRDQVRGAFSKLIKTKEVTTQGSNKYLVVIVCKYDSYQFGKRDGDDVDTTQIPHKSHTNPIQTPTTNNNNNNNKDNKYSSTREVKSICQSEELWVEAVKNNYVLSQKQFDDYLEKFTNHAMVQGKTTHSTDDFKKHFISWYKKHTGKGMNGRKLVKYKKPTL